MKAAISIKTAAPTRAISNVGAKATAEDITARARVNQMVAQAQRAIEHTRWGIMLSLRQIHDGLTGQILVIGIDGTIWLIV